MGFLGKLLGQSAITGGLGALFGGASSALGYAYNRKLMEAQQRYNTSERLAQQEYNTSERLAAQQYNTGEREAQNAYAEQMYNTYSSPAALVRQYEDAGLNPRLAIGSNTAGSVAASSGHSATVSPQSSGMLGITPPYQDISSFSQGFVNVANALKSLAEAKKSGVETKRLEAFLQDELKGLQYQNRATELANLFNEKVLARADQKLDAEIKSILTGIANGQLEGKVLEQKIELLKKENVLQGYAADHWLEKFQAEQDIRKATKEELEAGAALKKAQKETEEKRPKLVEAETYKARREGARVGSEIALNWSRAYTEGANQQLISVQTGIAKIQKEIDEYTKDVEKEFTHEHFVRMRQSLATYQDILNEQLITARKNNNFYEVKMIGELLTDIAQIGIAIGVNRKAKSARNHTVKDAE